VRLEERTALERFRAARVARLATAGADGAPHIVPVTFVLWEHEGVPMLATAVDAKPKSSLQLQRLSNIRANGRVSALADHYHEDWMRLWWTRLDGVAIVLDEGRDAAAAMTMLVAKYPQYERVQPLGPIILMRVQRIRGWAYVD
jgi:PPOX class probable F420-dependent enzyme